MSNRFNLPHHIHAHLTAVITLFPWLKCFQLHLQPCWQFIKQWYTVLPLLIFLLVLHGVEKKAQNTHFFSRHTGNGDRSELACCITMTTGGSGKQQLLTLHLNVWQGSPIRAPGTLIKTRKRMINVQLSFVQRLKCTQGHFDDNCWAGFNTLHTFYHKAWVPVPEFLIWGHKACTPVKF